MGAIVADNTTALPTWLLVALVAGNQDRSAFTSGYRTVSWSGYTWKVRGVQSAAMPGPNDWSDSTANVDVVGGALQINVVKSGSVYICSEVELEQTLGYGKYSFVVNTDLSGLDPWAVLGIYTYDSSTSSPYREIDIEAAKWGVADTDDLQFTVQPGTDSQTARFPANSSAPYTLEMTWQAGQVYYEARDSGGVVMRSWAVNNSVPTTGAEHLLINAWLHAGHAPNTAATVPFELASFTFTAAATKTLPKADTLSESFSSTPADWLAYNGATISGGNAVLPCTPAYSRWESGQKYDLISSSTQIDVAGLPAIGNVSTEAQFFAWHDWQNYVLIEKIGVNLLCRVRSAGTDTDNYLTYNAVNHRYWRIDESAGNILFKVSANGSSWTTAFTVAHSMAAALGIVQVRLSSGYYATETSPGDFLIAQVGSAAGVTVTPNSVAAVAAVPAPTVSTGSTVAASSAAATAAVPAPTTRTGSTVAPASVAATAGIPAPTVSTGSRATPAAVSATAAVPAPATATGSTISVSAVAATAAVPSPATSTGSGVAPGSVAGTAAVPAPSVTTAGNASVTPTAVAAVAAVPTPTVATGSSITTGSVGAITAVPAPVVGAGTGTSPGSVSGVASVPTPTVSAGATSGATAVQGVAAVPSPTISTGSGVLPSAVSAAAGVPAPTTRTGSTVTPASVAAVAQVPAVTVTAGGTTTINATAVAATAAVPSPALSTGIRVIPSAVSAAVSVPSPSVATGSRVTTTSVSAVVSVGTPVTSLGTTTLPASVSALAALGTAVVAAGSSAAVIAVTASAAVPSGAVSTGSSLTILTVSAVVSVPGVEVSVGFAVADSVASVSARRTSVAVTSASRTSVNAVSATRSSSSTVSGG